ncbi:hypothetical protein [Nonomuraea harbinensis]|uniref:Uncharacterized protein n=1 Tax=Nonomuraea harbinensis TaxID=1286938 RepID=A0ABW1CBP8_9ACTN|nr:hypothetical protein [Nonomuraea harbinensis]
MHTHAPSRRPAVARRTGYTIAAVVNATLLYGVNAHPGWQAVPFLTPETVRVLPLVNLSLIVALLTNMILLVRDPRWARPAGDLVVTLIGLAALARFLAVFPVAFDHPAVDWATVVRTVAIVAIALTAIAAIAHLASLVRYAAGRR